MAEEAAAGRKPNCGVVAGSCHAGEVVTLKLLGRFRRNKVHGISLLSRLSES
jgi:hypothetical protein